MDELTDRRTDRRKNNALCSRTPLPRGEVIKQVWLNSDDDEYDDDDDDDYDVDEYGLLISKYIQYPHQPALQGQLNTAPPPHPLPITPSQLYLHG